MRTNECPLLLSTKKGIGYTQAILIGQLCTIIAKYKYCFTVKA